MTPSSFPAGGGESRPNGTGWMPLEKWAEMTDTSWNVALAYANPKSKRTGKMFHAADVDRRSNQDIKVWYQAPNVVTGFRRPRLIPRSSIHEVRKGEQLEV